MQEEVSEWLNPWRLPPWQWNLILIAAALLVGILLKLALSLFLRKKTDPAKQFSFFSSLLVNLTGPLTFLLPLFFLNLFLPVMKFPHVLLDKFDTLLEILLTLFCSWIIIECSNVFRDYINYRYDIGKADNLKERKIRTQLLYIHQIFVVLVVIVTIAIVLLSFNTLRKIGTGLLTGVGISGIIIGIAAQRSLANVLAGLQIAFTQPIRIDDQVVVENEFGTIEEITLTYVVVKIWDKRRLILPITYFVEKPFQNWTRTTADLLGTVFIYTDYEVPVEELQAELIRLLNLNVRWDKNVAELQVTNMTDRSVEVRALVSAVSSGDLFNLRCDIRKDLLFFLRKNYPHSLPKARMKLDDPQNG